MRRREEGFTLVEILIAVALLGMLTVLAYSAVRSAAFSWRFEAQRRDNEAERDAVARVLTQAVRRAYPAFASNVYGDRRIAFDGGEDSLSLITLLPDAIEPEVMARVSFYVRSGAANAGLTMAWWLDLPTATGGTFLPHLVELAPDVSMVRFTYFGSSQASQAPTWRNRWTGMTLMPGLVRVRAWRLGAPQQPWLDISVETWTSANSDCIYLAEEPACRRLE